MTKQTKHYAEEEKKKLLEGISSLYICGSENMTEDEIFERLELAQEETEEQRVAADKKKIN